MPSTPSNRAQLTDFSKLSLEYARDIKAQTGRPLHPKQIKRLAQELRDKKYGKLSSADGRQHRKAFEAKVNGKTLKDRLIKEWESQTGQKWPRYTEDVYNPATGKLLREKGQPYDAHHVIENSYGGPHEWWNLHPAKHPNEHQGGIHRAGNPGDRAHEGVNQR